MRSFALLALIACAEPIVDDGFVPNYEDHIAPLLERECLRCHTHAALMRDGVELDTYVSARSTRISSVCTSVSPDIIDLFPDALVSDAALPGEGPCADWRALSMPPGAMPRLTVQDQLLFAQWVAAGAPEVAP